MSIETMTKLATTTLNANTASVTFSSIPQGYTDLKVVWSGRQSRNEYVAAYTLVQFNSSTSGYTYRTFQADVPGTPTSQTESGVGISTGIVIGFVSNNNNTANTFGSTEMYVSNYSSSNYKTVSGEGMSENNSSNTGILMTTGLWSNTAAITSITLSPWVGSSFNWLTHSTFTLYGVKAARTAVGNSIKAVGGNISFDGTYVVHTFNTSGTFTPSDSLRVDYLVVAGGGGGAGGSGVDGGGGGGAGGLRSTVTSTGGGGSLESALSLTSGTNYTVTIGAGGAASTANGTAPSGSNSVFYTITATGGGGGGSNNEVGGNGGSGGGSGGFNNAGNPAGRQGIRTASPVQGNDGQVGSYYVNVSAGTNYGGGGGGAGATGSTGDGGNGTAVAISGSSVTYAGGGGGSYQTAGTFKTGGTGGGGRGGEQNSVAGSAGTANTGGGGGGGWNTAGGAGGSGVVIIRYRAIA